MLLNKSLHAKNTAMALSVPNPWGKHSSLSSRSVHQYTYRRSPLGCRVFKERENFLGCFPQPMLRPYSIPPPPLVYTQAPVLLTIMPKHMWGNSKLKRKLYWPKCEYRGYLTQHSHSSEFYLWLTTHLSINTLIGWLPPYTQDLHWLSMLITPNLCFLPRISNCSLALSQAQRI